MVLMFDVSHLISNVRGEILRILIRTSQELKDKKALWLCFFLQSKPQDNRKTEMANEGAVSSSSERIHELLLRNLQEVFGEGDPVRRLASIKEL